MTDTTTPLPTVDAPATAVDQTVTQLITGAESIAVPAEEAAIIAAVPAMAAPVWIQIWETALGALNKFIFGVVASYLAPKAGYIVMDVQGYLNLTNAAAALAALNKANASGDRAAIATANAAANAAEAPVLHYVGQIKT